MSDPSSSEKMLKQLDAPGAPNIAFGYLVYQQLAAILGAIGLAALFGHFIQFDWRGLFKTLLDLWDSTVRPTVDYILAATIVPLAWAFGWHLVIPALARDYLSAGAILSLSAARIEFADYRRDIAGFSSIQSRGARRALEVTFDLSLFVIMTVVLAIAWPLLLAVLVVGILFGVRDAAKKRRGSDDFDWTDIKYMLLVLLPFGYLAVGALLNKILYP